MLVESCPDSEIFTFVIGIEALKSLIRQGRKWYSGVNIVIPSGLPELGLLACINPLGHRQSKTFLR
jgi:hypothetical protein